MAAIEWVLREERGGALEFDTWTLDLGDGVLVRLQRVVEKRWSPFQFGLQLCGHTVLHGVELLATEEVDAKKEALALASKNLRRWLKKTIDASVKL